MHRLSAFISNGTWALSFFWKYSRKVTLVNIIFNSISSLSTLINAFIISKLIDETIYIIENNEEPNKAFGLIALICTILIVLKIISSINDYYSKYLDEVVRYYPKQLMYEKLNKLSVAELEKPELNNKINRFQESIYSIKVYFDLVIGFFSEATLLLLSFISVIYILPIHIALSVLLVVPTILISNKNLKKLHKHRVNSTEERRKVNMLTNFMLETERFTEIRLSNSYEFIKDQFESFNKWSIKEVFSIRKDWFIKLYFFEVLQILIFLYQLIMLGSNGEISTGQIAFIYSTFTLVALNLKRIVNTVTNINDFNNRHSDIRDVFDWKEDNINSGIILEDTKLPPKLILRNVEFQYSKANEPTLKNINLEINPGEKIAIVGHNGAGKTTLVKLISKIYPATKGQILIDGSNLNEINSESWNRQLGILFQTYNNYGPLTAKENIAIGDIHKPFDEGSLKDAALKADALDFINKYPNKFDQVLSEKYKNGIRPSTGQWQKIAIARFFYRNAPVLILDEPTASIDAEAEEKIFNRIYEFIENKTVIIISHRFSTVRKADRIVVLDQSEIVEQGSHKELMELNGKYKKLFELQARSYS
ncbi:MAG: ABC transporter ATP-binding protein [Candidatus Dojkabacteria bacterium]|nr:ABC transporter ATP-binding protein [Candidatus Dojkabacteria bacterium]MDQ7021253.1 ABC transporter ATP-binding protein [Candidatus Dojkabacteria bacterium]